MARRRMASLDIIDTDKFTEMPSSTQCLYFHLLMRGDDDGFVTSPKKIMRTVGSSEDDLKLLLLKKYIIPFESGICVIKDWKIHNYIRKDRYTETVHLDEKSLLTTTLNGAYNLKSNIVTISCPPREEIKQISTGTIINTPPDEKVVSIEPLKQAFLEMLKTSKSYTPNEKLDDLLWTSTVRILESESEVLKALSMIIFSTPKEDDSTNIRSRLTGYVSHIATQREKEKRNSEAKAAHANEALAHIEDIKNDDCISPAEGIKTKDDAINYIKQAPRSVRGRSSFHNELMTKFNIDVSEIISEEVTSA